MSSSSFKIAFTVGLIASAGVAFPACGSDDEEKPSGNAGTAAGATGGAGGTSGTGAGGTSGTGAGGTSGTGSGGTGGRGGSIMCGPNTCQSAGFGVAPACCLPGNRCGIDPPELVVDGGDLPCTEINQPGNPDPSCFADSGIDLNDSGFDADQFDAGNLLEAGIFQIPGCCRPNGMCGILVNFPMVQLNLGCVDPTQYGAIFDAGAPGPCTPRIDAGGNRDSSVD